MSRLSSICDAMRRNLPGCVLSMAVAWQVTIGSGLPAMAAGSPASRDESAAPHSTSLSPERQAALADDLKLLTNGNFAERQAATSRILKVGAAAIPNVDAALKNASTSNRDRLGVISRTLRARAIEEILRQQTDSGGVEAFQTFSDWNRLLELNANHADSGPLFRELLQAEPQLFATRRFGTSAELSQHLMERSSALAARFNGDTATDFPMASYMALLLIATDERVRLPRNTSTNLSLGLQDSRLIALTLKAKGDAPWPAIPTAWMKRPAIDRTRPLLYGFRTGLPGTLQAARDILSTPNGRPETAYALLAVARFGTPDDLPLLESLLEDSTPLWPVGGRLPIREGLPSGYRVEVSDLALAAALTLRGIAPETTGFPFLQRNELTTFSLSTAGFSSPENRDAAVERYRADYRLPAPSP